MQLFLSTERKLCKSPLLRDKYVEFMTQYVQLHHMSLADTDHAQTKFFLPHHAVFCKHDPSKKIRVIFNASFKSSTGFSLNNKLLAGPKLQSELWVVLSRWRLFRFAFSTDIEKMFHQIMVNPKVQDLQRILWRDNPDSKISEFRLSTVTYAQSFATTREWRRTPLPFSFANYAQKFVHGRHFLWRRFH